MNRQNIVKIFGKSFPDEWHNATKFGIKVAWFGTGSTYTANGIVDFLKEVEASLPKSITQVLPRADSGFFS
jgi:hypothetical protein